MNRKRDKIARSQKIQEKRRNKRNESKRKNAHISVEKLNHRSNVVQAQKKEIFENWMKQVVEQFESSHRKN